MGILENLDWNALFQALLGAFANCPSENTVEQRERAVRHPLRMRRAVVRTLRNQYPQLRGHSLRQATNEVVEKIKSAPAEEIRDFCRLSLEIANDE